MHGRNFLGADKSAEGTDTVAAVNPATGETLPPRFHVATDAEVDRAARLADAAFFPYRALPADARAALLERIADEIDALGSELLECAHQETALPLARLTGERARTTGQLRQFAAVVRDGAWTEARIDTALPDRAPLPRPDLRRMLIPLGPVAVFGAGNFPFAFSVAGGDTASALAAGCPVVVKAHPAHPATSEMTAEAVRAAIVALKIPDGVFSLVHGLQDVGRALVRHESIAAVGFTGSLAAGRALFNEAAARPRPIPVYAEMGSVNPVFLLPGALGERGKAIAEGFALSVTTGVGQFCTNPGLAFGVRGPDLDAFLATVREKVVQTPPATMLFPAIRDKFGAGLDRLTATPGVDTVARSSAPADPAQTHAESAVFSTDAATFTQTPALAEEVFGPSSLVVHAGTPDELESLALALEGQLTASVHGTPADLKTYARLLSILETKAGRLIFNGFPTGVEVSPAMQHGGPYPATTDSRTTSVGTAAIARFARPVCYQNFPPDALPEELQDANPLSLWRLVNGEWTRAAL